LGTLTKRVCTFEEVEAALGKGDSSRKTIPLEIERLEKSPLSKSNSEAAGYKKQLREEND